MGPLVRQSQVLNLVRIMTFRKNCSDGFRASFRDMSRQFLERFYLLALVVKNVMTSFFMYFYIL
jgi:hypothetical protein